MQRNSGPGRQRWPRLGQQLGRGLVADHRPCGRSWVRRRGPAPMLATNSALTLGMHHSFFCHGLRAFFWTLAHALVGPGGRQPQRDHHLPSRRPGSRLMPLRIAGQAKATRCASPRFPTGWPGAGPARALSNPSPEQRCLIRITVPSATSRASATWGAAQPSSLLKQNPGSGGHLAELFPTRIRGWREVQALVKERNAAQDARTK